jgi:hypothetical protein
MLCLPPGEEELFVRQRKTFRHAHALRDTHARQGSAQAEDGHAPAGAALPDQLRTYRGHGLHRERAGERPDSPFVLYPGPDAVNFKTLGKDALPAKKTLLVFVIDGTWRGARSLLNKSPNVRALPRLSFAGNYVSQFKIKKQPMEHCVSTIEAIYYLCREAEAAGYEDLGAGPEVLMQVFKRLVDTQIRCQQAKGRPREEGPEE